MPRKRKEQKAKMTKKVRARKQTSRLSFSQWFFDSVFIGSQGTLAFLGLVKAQGRKPKISAKD
jgi:hypothetical protein